jgi:hypothetical protein
LQRACEVQIAAQSGGARLVLPDRAACEWVESEVKRTNSFDSAAKAWPALLTMLDEVDPGYRD